MDVCLFFAKDDAILNKFLLQLRNDFVITSELDVGAFLGIDVRCTPEVHMQLTQSSLISKIVEACGLESESKRHDTPAETKILQKDTAGAQREHSWKYCTLTGILTYFSVSSHPDVAFAVHQCALASAKTPSAFMKLPFIASFATSMVHLPMDISSAPAPPIAT